MHFLILLVSFTSPKESLPMSDKSFTSKAHKTIALLKQLEGSTHSRSMFQYSKEKDPIHVKEVLAEAIKVIDSMAEAMRLFEAPIEEFSVDQVELFKVYTTDGHVFHQNKKSAVSRMRVGSIRECNVYSDPSKMFILKVNRQGGLDEKFRFVSSFKEAMTLKVLHNV